MRLVCGESLRYVTGPVSGGNGNLAEARRTVSSAYIVLGYLKNCRSLKWADWTFCWAPDLVQLLSLDFILRLAVMAATRYRILHAYSPARLLIYQICRRRWRRQRIPSDDPSTLLLPSDGNYQKDRNLPDGTFSSDGTERDMRT
jgi:hypothetical protein